MGKKQKLIFIGNSFTYWGKTVIEKSSSVTDMEQRKNDTGLFHRLCRECGTDIEVTNWTWAGHHLEDLFGKSCKNPDSCKGTCHLPQLTDTDHDFVVVQEGSQPTRRQDLTHYLKMITEIFGNGSRKTRFIFLIQSRVYTMNGTDLLSKTEEIKALGYSVVDWGRLVFDVMNGTVKVPYAECSYTKDTFIINRSEGDGFHPNMLTGYIVAAMTYCAVTGGSAKELPHAFVTDPVFDIEGFIKKNYILAETNFHNVLASENDMRGLKTLMDVYLDR